jgi:hypothetical protein
MTSLRVVGAECDVDLVDASDLRLRRLSSAAFGNSSMAHALLCASQQTARGHPVTTRSVARALGAGDSTIRPVVMRLIDAGCLEAWPSARSGKRAYRLTSPVGSAAAELAEQLRLSACQRVIEHVML